MIRNMIALLTLIHLPRLRHKQFVLYVFVLPLVILVISMLNQSSRHGEQLHYKVLLISMIGVIISSFFNGMRVFGKVQRHSILASLPVRRVKIFLTQLVTILIDAELSAMTLVCIGYFVWHFPLDLAWILPYQYLILSTTIVMVGIGIILIQTTGSLPSAMAWARIIMMFIFFAGGSGYVPVTAFPKAVVVLQNFLPTGIMRLDLTHIVYAQGITLRDFVLMSIWQVVLIALAYGLHALAARSTPDTGS